MKNGSVVRSEKSLAALTPLPEQAPKKSGSSSSPKSELPSIKLTKKDFKLLEKLFTADMFDRLPFQSPNKHLFNLEERGLVQQMQITLPGRFPVVVKGWALTIRGHYAYCSNC